MLHHSCGLTRGCLAWLRGVDSKVHLFIFLFDFIVFTQYISHFGDGALDACQSLLIRNHLSSVLWYLQRRTLTVLVETGIPKNLAVLMSSQSLSACQSSCHQQSWSKQKGLSWNKSSRKRNFSLRLRASFYFAPGGAAHIHLVNFRMIWATFPPRARKPHLYFWQFVVRSSYVGRDPGFWCGTTMYVNGTWDNKTN